MRIHCCSGVCGGKQCGTLCCAGLAHEPHRNPYKFGLRYERFCRFPKICAMGALRIKKDVNRARTHGRTYGETFCFSLNSGDRNWRGRYISLRSRVAIVSALVTAAEGESCCDECNCKKC